MRVPGLLFVALLLAPAAPDAQITVRPGQYEYTIDMNSRQRLRTECITPAQANEAKQDVVKLFARQMNAGSCKTSDLKASGNKVTFTTTCDEGGMPMVMSNEMTFGVDSFTNVGKMKDPTGRILTSTVTAKRVGDCK
jgi:hypothetical protein